MKLKKVKVRASLYGWIQKGKFISYPEAYIDKKEEAKVLTDVIVRASKSILGIGDLNENFMLVLEKYQNYLNGIKDQTYFESFFTKTLAFFCVF